ncbi:pollen receptor-like kinase 4 [Zingiber officinale]|uniref:pollen receptor-like kinase 4 n=1 Tax=Zingiber officinale TaxID=94328 RepID=UPI001C4B655C|nr:pollen receptor-like kinase 4 [Zingiber officinale]
MDGRRPLPLLVVVLLLLLARRSLTSPDADVLFAFKATIVDNSGSLSSWIPDTDPCSGHVTKWAGVICDNEGSVDGLRLENMNLAGVIDVGPLAALPQLRSFSIINNGFAGTMPEFGKLTSLKAVYLSRNKFSGELPDASFAGMSWLKKLYLSNNQFAGAIPASVAALPRLLELGLDGNRFAGAIPQFRSNELKMVNLSNNNLEGSIPAGISNMDASLFSGNEGLCGKPLQVSCSLSSSSSSSPSSPSSNQPLLHMSSMVVLSLVLAIIAIILSTRRRPPVKNVAVKNSKPAPTKEEMMEEGTTRSGGGSTTSKKSTKETDQGRLIFVKEGIGKFDLRDLLKSSAEVLATGNFVTAYKAALPNGTAMVVKRFRNMNRVGKEDFDEHMRRLGRLSHPNLLPLVAYYYRKDEKLLVTGYAVKRSLADLLHGSRLKASVDWFTRLKIVKGVAKGLNYLYEELQMLSVPHGHLKSTNVLLNDSLQPLLTDFALIPVMNPAHAAQFMAAFKCPEYKKQERTCKKSDVWSLGVLILEILTGKVPATEKGGTDLPALVSSVPREEWASKVLDGEVQPTPAATTKEALIELLQIGLDCCEEDDEKRCELEEALDRIEALKEASSGDHAAIDIN